MRSIAYDPAGTPADCFAISGEISRTKALLLVHVVFTAVVAAAGALTPLLRLDPENLVYPACLLVTGAFIWMLWSWYAIRNTLFEPYSLFLIAAGLFNAGQALLEVFDMNPGGVLNGAVAPDLLAKALFLVTISMLCFHAGALLMLNRQQQRRPPEESAPQCQRAVRWVGWLLLAVALVPTVNILRGFFGLVLDYGYLGLYSQSAVLPVSWALAAFMTPATIFLLAGSKRSRWTQLFALALTAGYASTYLFLGARSPAAMSCIAVAWIFESSIRRIPRSLILLFSLCAFLIFPLIRETRNTGGRYRMPWDNQIEIMSTLQNPISSSIGEMGHSLVTVTHTLALVPDIRPYDLGVSYFYAAATIVPNLGWKVHPSVSHGLLADWLIATVDPGIAYSGGGLGFSFIAEAYLNFGWFGGPLCLGILGFCVTSLFVAADGGDPAKRALVASFLSFFLIFPRGESAIIARGLIWYAVTPYLLTKVLTRRTRAREADL